MIESLKTILSLSREATNFDRWRHDCRDTHVEDFSHDEEEEEDDDSDDVMKPMKVDIDLSLSAHSNAKR